MCFEALKCILKWVSEPWSWDDFVPEHLSLAELAMSERCWLMLHTEDAPSSRPHKFALLFSTGQVQKLLCITHNFYS